MGRGGGEGLTRLLGDFAFGFVGGIFDFGVEAFEEAGDEGVEVGVVVGVLKLVGEGDVAGEVGEDDAPGERVLPGAGADGDVLALLGDPDAEDLEGRFVALRGWGDRQVLVCGHKEVPRFQNFTTVDYSLLFQA